MTTKFDVYSRRPYGYPGQFLIRDDGVIVEYNPLIAKLPNFKPYNPNCDFDFDNATKTDVSKYAKKYYKTVLPDTMTLVQMKQELQGLMNDHTRFDDFN